MSGFVDRFKKEKTFATQEGKQITNLPVDDITSDPDQVRKTFAEEKLQELANSIKAKGVQNPIHVRPSDTELDQWIIITGERRWRATQMAGITHIPAICHPHTINEQEIRVLQMVENLQREDLNVADMILGFQSMSSLEMSQAEISRVVGVSKGTVSKVFKIISQFPQKWMETIQKICANGHDIPLSHLYNIALESNTNRRNALYAKLLKDCKYDEDAPEKVPEQEQQEPEQKKSKKERFPPDKVWDCLKKIAKKDREELLKYIPSDKLEKLFEEYSN